MSYQKSNLSGSRQDCGLVDQFKNMLILGLAIPERVHIRERIREDCQLARMRSFLYGPSDSKSLLNNNVLARDLIR